MKKLLQFAVGQPVTILMMVMALLLLGKISYDQLGVDLLPNLNSPKLFVELSSGEKPPEEIEKQFIESMESMAIRQRDVIRVSSVVRAGSAQMIVEYSWRKDMDEAFLDLQKALSSYSQNSAIEELRITQHDPNTEPVLLLAFSHKTITDMSELRKVAESYVRNELIRLEGVADVTLSGEEITELVIHTDRYKLKAFNITLDEIASRINASNQSLSGGRVTELGLQYIVKGVSTLHSEEDFRNLIVGYRNVTAATTGGAVSSKAPVYLKDLATVEFKNRRPENIVRMDGKRSMGLAVFKETRFNTVTTVSEVFKSLTTIEKALPGYSLQIVSNQGEFIQSAIEEVKGTALLGIALAIFVLFLFLRRIGLTLLVSTAFPISIIATFNLMYYNGLTLNIMTLGGLALGAGMLVDNAIVVIENIFRNHEEGLSAADASVKGTSEVGGAITSSTLTTIVVFLPIVFLHGASGELFKDQALTVTYSLLCSLFVAVMVIPMLYNQIYGRKKLKTNASIRFGAYGRFLKALMPFKWLVILVSFLLLGFTAIMVPYIGIDFMPKPESRSFVMEVKMPEGTRLERTSATMASIEEMIVELAGDTLCKVYSHTGPGAGLQTDVFEGEHTGQMRVLLEPHHPPVEQMIADLSLNTEMIEGLELAFRQDESSLSTLLGSEGAPVVVEVKGDDLDELALLTNEVKERMEGIDGLFNVVSSSEDGAPEVEILLDRVRTGMYSLNASNIVTQIRQQLEGNEAGEVEYQGEMRPIMLKVPEISLSELSMLPVTGGQQEFRLHELAELRTSTAPREIFRRNQSRIGKVTASIEDYLTLDHAAQQIRDAVSDIQLPANYTITVTGEEEKRQEAMSSLGWALILSVILVYMVMAAQFESLSHPFTVLFTLPLAVVGALLGFLVTGISINIMGVIGIVMLVGIAVNSSIILVDRINQLKKTGLSRHDAIAMAGRQRIRPILMTASTTILALLPLAFGFGTSSALRAPMAIAVVGGMVTATILTLVLIPCVYDVVDTATERLFGSSKSRLSDASQSTKINS